ncbi:YeiH family protein [Methylophaga sulfidovorans]|uniref:Conserved hypothetical integral membrane protein n=1 Tax=Methylophaga sulfidovorans TaxID=45496 RepID=A0A1I4BZN2_9GAMM|nr:YeiH family protein [Methylophaga sulfidovorans]SFK74258.1 conserved hypothetical integral membrane protein [Methylophaga sulfidovorans]
MHNTSNISSPVSHIFDAKMLSGLLLVVVLSVAGMLAAKLPMFNQLGLSALTIAILLGMIIGNTVFPHIAEQTSVGVDFSKNRLLRAGIILYGFRITFQQVMNIGVSGICIDIAVLTLTFTLAYYAGRHLFKLDKETAILIGAGSSICGAAAVMATEPVIKAQAHKVTVAVATVVIFGTISMFVYPLVYPYLGLSEQHYGIFVGSTIHEVAQVVAAGKAVSDTAANTALIEKMLRVMMLAPFLLLIGQLAANKTHSEHSGQRAPITIPWFAVLFIVVTAFNSVVEMSPLLHKVLISIDTLFLTMAMTALGLRTHLGAIKQAGLKPILLGLLLFVMLTVGGYYINSFFQNWV